MMMLKNTDVCQMIANWLSVEIGFGNSKLVFHYAPADLDIFEAQLCFQLDGCYRDTMLEAYGFGGAFGRLGLKVLARRVLGRTRLSWEETVTPYSKEVLGEWMMNGYVHSEQNWRTTTSRFHKKSGKPLKPIITPALPEKLLYEIWRNSLSNPDYDVWERLSGRMPKEWMSKLIDELGPVPQKGIAHCPIDVQVEYACSDADDTRQLAVEFDRMRRELVAELNIQEEDEDVGVGNGMGDGLRDRQEVGTR
jgi:hypothetical protein